MQINDNAMEDTAALCGELYHYMAFGGGLDKLKDEVEVVGDRISGACLRIAACAAHVVDELVDWPEATGVFSYECIERVDDSMHPSSLPAVLIQKLPADVWFVVSEHGVVPMEPIRQIVEEYLEEYCSGPATNFPLKPKPEAREQLQMPHWRTDRA